MAANKDLGKLLKKLDEQDGFTYRRTSKGHYQVSKDGKVIAVLSGTPSDHRSWLNGLADLKREGFIP